MAGNLNSGRRADPTRRSGRFAADRFPRFGGEPIKPNNLSGEASKLWDELVPMLANAGVAKAVDGPALEMLCRVWADWKRLQPE